MLRSEPIGITPPAAYSAELIVPRPLTVYEPGCFASPNTNTRIERVSAIVTFALTPIIWRRTRASSEAFTLAKVCPATLIGPSWGKLTRPSRPTTS